jgi:hypothetical protein
MQRIKNYINPNICFECGSLSEQNHHIIPKIYGGIKTIPLCQKCHDKIHGVTRLNINKLTKDALDRKRIREPNHKFGSPQNLTNEARSKGWASTKLKARTDPSVIMAYSIIKPMREDGFTFQYICDKLNTEGYKTRTSKYFHPMQVLNIWNRFNIK